MHTKSVTVKNFDELPVILTVKDVAQAIGVSLPIAYELTKRDGFPSLKISERRIVIPKEAFKMWLNEQVCV